MKKILIIGSVHLDIVGKFLPDVKERTDKEGSLRYSVGGAAYNIAANLAYKGYVVSVFTYLKKNSLSTSIIKNALSGAKIDTKYVSEDIDLSESGYIAHSMSGDLVSAVSSMALQEKAFDDKEIARLQRAIKEHDVIVIDTNLTSGQIDKICDMTSSRGRSLFVCNVSDSKCHRLVDVVTNKSTGLFGLVSLNEKELTTIFGEAEKPTCEDICSKLGSEIVLVTHGKKGHTVITRDELCRFPGASVQATAIKSELGAGDALFSAVVSHYIDNGTINWKDCEQTINDYVGRILKSEGATPEGLILDFESQKSSEDKQSIVALGSLLLSAAFTTSGFFLDLGPEIYAALFLLIPFLSGIGGAFVRHLLGKATSMSKNVLTNIALGGIAGLIVSFTFFLSHWATLGTSISSMISGSGVSDNMRPMLGFLFVSAFVAGLAVEVAFEKVERANVNDLVQK